MRWLVSLVLLTLALTDSFAASAQGVLDRVEPTRLEERTLDKTETEGHVATGFDHASTIASSSDKAVFVGAIEIVGLTVLRNSDFSDIVQRFIGRSLNSPEIALLADGLADRARERFPLATARVGPQNITGGILRVEVDEGRVDAVELAGFHNARLKKLFAGIVTGRPATAADLEAAVLLARDVVGISIRETTIRRDGDRNTLVVNGSYSRFSGQLSVDNDSIRPIGPFETFGFAQANGLLSHDDSLQVYFLAALPQPQELGFARLRYAKRIDNAGTEISAAGSYSRSMPGSYLAPLAIVDESWWGSIGFSRPLVRSVPHSVWVDGSLSWRDLHQERAGIAWRSDRVVAARVRLAGNVRAVGGVLQSGGTISQGLGILGATRRGTMASRPDADGTFTSLVLSANWTRQMTGQFSVRAAIRSQLASAPLLVSEEIGLGGASFARGYDYSERSGDRGTMGYLEVNHGFKKIGPVRSLKSYVFIDGGRVTNLGREPGGGSLFSAGGGSRLDIDRRTDAYIEIAVPLLGKRYETDSKSPRIRVSLTRYF